MKKTLGVCFGNKGWICGKEFTSKHFMERHKVTHADAADKPFHCQDCGKTFTHQNGFTNHKKSHLDDRYQCDDDSCGQVFSCGKDLKLHSKKHKITTKPPQCDICGRKFSDSWNCKRHRQTHDGVKPFTCPLCQKTFQNEKDMTSHSVTHTGEKAYKCVLCPSSFTHYRGLQGHMNIHTDKAKPCDLGCGRVFSNQSALKQHLLKCRLNPSAPRNKVQSSQKLGKWAYKPIKPSVVPDELSETTSKLIFRCKLCHSQFENYAGIQEHIESHKAQRKGEVFWMGQDKVVVSIELQDGGEDIEKVIDGVDTAMEAAPTEDVIVRTVDKPEMEDEEDGSYDEEGETVDTVIVVEYVDS